MSSQDEKDNELWNLYVGAGGVGSSLTEIFLRAATERAEQMNELVTRMVALENKLNALEYGLSAVAEQVGDDEGPEVPGAITFVDCEVHIYG